MIYRLKKYLGNNLTTEAYYETLNLAKQAAIRAVNEDKELLCVVAPCKFVDGILIIDDEAKWYQYNFNEKLNHISSWEY